ncbi:hypothetical protein A8H39_04265 [Paraburkholderia fungorum]|nr:hypothetical protein A8H39_04265 [Paraburkholderia fungorum]PZR50720.1 MAG: hypothetical protein DI523_03075 [Paraburkholderia fungorum]QLD53971.1 hypothetical protein C9419_33455 [Paraburkholderia fungorum]
MAAEHQNKNVTVRGTRRIGNVPRAVMLQLDVSLYTLLQILSVSVFEKTGISCALRPDPSPRISSRAYREDSEGARVYYNYALKGKDGKTPAMRLGLSIHVVKLDELLGVHEARKRPSEPRSKGL